MPYQRPRPEDFMDENMEIDWDAYNEAIDAMEEDRYHTIRDESGDQKHQQKKDKKEVEDGNNEYERGKL